tara:strand:- start:4466 stop:4816 length:351 start_codon:yes stop_codon:yes gene_type:complete
MNDKEGNKLTGRGGTGRGQGRKKGSKNKTPSRRLIEQAVCLKFGFESHEVDEAKKELLLKYMAGDKGLQFVVETLFGKAVDVLHLEADVKVTTERKAEDLEDLFNEDEDEDEPEDD